MKDPNPYSPHPAASTATANCRCDWHALADAVGWYRATLRRGGRLAAGDRDELHHAVERLREHAPDLAKLIGGVQ